MEELKTREVNGKVKFMAYNDNFIERFNMLKNKRYIVHVHMGLNTLLLLALELYLYELICFSEISPIQAYNMCNI